MLGPQPQAEGLSNPSHTHTGGPAAPAHLVHTLAAWPTLPVLLTASRSPSHTPCPVCCRLLPPPTGQGWASLRLPSPSAPWLLPQPSAPFPGRTCHLARSPPSSAWSQGLTCGPGTPQGLLCPRALAQAALWAWSIPPSPPCEFPSVLRAVGTGVERPGQGSPGSEAQEPACQHQLLP